MRLQVLKGLEIVDFAKNNSEDMTVVGERNLRLLRICISRDQTIRADNFCRSYKNLYLCFVIIIIV